jgi:hypothetical protein
MISPPSHAGGGTSTSTAEGGGGPRPASPAHLDQNSNKSGPLSRPVAQQQTLSGADAARHYLSTSPLHQRSLDLLPAASASSSAFLPAPGAEFRPPWLPEQRTAVGPWLPPPPPPSALLLHSLQLGFAGASPQPSSRGGGGLLLPSAVGFSRLGGGIFSPLGLQAAAAAAAAGYFPPPPMLEQRYHRPAVPASAAVSTYSPSSSSSSPLPLHFPPGSPLTSLPPNDTVPTTAKKGGHKRKWDESSLKEEEEEERRRVALLSSAASIAPPVGDARPLKSRLLARSSPDVICQRAATPPTQPPAAYAVVGSSSSLAAAPIMSVRPAERYSSSSSGALARPGHPAHFTQVWGTEVGQLQSALVECRRPAVLSMKLPHAHC